MGRRSNRRVVIAAAACALVAAACGRPASVPDQVSPVKGLETVTPAGTKAVPSVVWRVYRDVDSLDPVFSIDFPEYTAVSLMCESLLRQAPDGSLQPGAATLSHPNPTTMVFTLRPGVKFWDGHRVTSADVVYSLERNVNPQLGGSYGPGIQPGRLDHRDQPGSGDDQAAAAGLLAGGRAVLDAGHRDREELRREAGQELRHPRRVDHVHRGVHARVLDPGHRRGRGPQPALLEPLGTPTGRQDHH